MKQDQFLKVIDRDEAERRFQAALNPQPLSAEEVPLDNALYRVLAQDVVAPLDVPSFDRANVDGFAVRAEDTFGATEDQPVILQLNAEILVTGTRPRLTVTKGTATSIATGAVVPRGADAVVMVEYTDTSEDQLIIRRPVTPGANVTFAGTDMGQGETVLRRGELLTSRETGLLAALGFTSIKVVSQPRVAILSTGNELIPPGQKMEPGLVYDSNATILADAVRELGGIPIRLGIVLDDKDSLRKKLEEALENDVVLLSGGTSKGEGDLSYREVADLGEPGIIAHGVALKPGKPLCLAAIRRGERLTPVVILPGFPTSAIFTFHEFVAPVIRQLAGRLQEKPALIPARLPMRINSERGRTEYLLIGLVENLPGQSPPNTAYPLGKGSGSVTTFSKADGFIIIPRQQEYLEANTIIQVHLLDRQLTAADLVVIGSHCVGLDYLLGLLQERGYRSKFLVAGSTGGLEAARRGECDLAGIHLFDVRTQSYNLPFVGSGLIFIKGYKRLQGIVFRRGDSRFESKTIEQAIHNALADLDCVMVNRNRGSGTRILLDQLLGSAKPAGYHTEAKSHNAVVAAVVQQRADWGLAISSVVDSAVLGFIPLREEHFDFVIPSQRIQRPAVQVFQHLLLELPTRHGLEKMGFRID